MGYDVLFKGCRARRSTGQGLTQVVVLDWNECRYVLINPEILEAEGCEVYEEGCLSFPEVFESVERPSRIRVKYRDADLEEHEEEVEGFLARVFCHGWIT